MGEASDAVLAALASESALDRGVLPVWADALEDSGREALAAGMRAAWRAGYTPQRQRSSLAGPTEECWLFLDRKVPGGDGAGHPRRSHFGDDWDPRSVLPEALFALAAGRTDVHSELDYLYFPHPSAAYLALAAVIGGVPAEAAEMGFEHLTKGE